MRALRLLHRHLPDLCDAGQRTRQPARPHLPDQGHAGRRKGGRQGDRHPYRPLPVLPRLHDDLPVGRELHASGRPCPRPYRKDLQAAPARPAGAGAARLRAAPPRPLPRRAAAGQARPALRRPVRGHGAETARRHAETGAKDGAGRLAGVAARQPRGEGCPARTRGAAHRLRAIRSRSGHQRGDRFAAHPPRRRSRRTARRRLLRRAGASHGQGGRSAGRCTPRPAGWMPS